MIPYILLYFVVAMILTFSINYRDKNLYWLVVVVLIIFSGIRYNVGMDYLTYLNSFYDIHYNADSRFEAITLLICNVVFGLGGSEQFVFMIYSVITLFGIAFFIDKYTLHKEIALFLFFTISIFFLATFNGIRQWAAISMFFVSLVYLKDKKYAHTLFFIIIAALFHSSALIIFLVVPFLCIRYKPKYIVGLMLVITFMKKLLLFIISLTPFSVYIDLLRFENTSSSVLLFIYIIILMYMLFIYKYFHIKHDLETRLVILLNLNVISIMVLYCGSFILGIDFLSVNRVNMFFEVQLIILIPEAFAMIEHRLTQQLVIYLSVVIFSLFFFYTLFINGYKYNLVPYTSYLFG